MRTPVLEEAGVQFRLKTEELKPVPETCVNLVTVNHFHWYFSLST